MVGASYISRTVGRRSRWFASGLVAMSAGCSFVPKARMDESRRVNQTLRADNTRLKDVALDLQTQNQDLSDRAVDDARRLAVQTDALERLEKSVVGYQADRHKIDQSFESIKRQIRLSSESRPDPGPVSDIGAAPVSDNSPRLADRLSSFADRYPGWSFDPATGTVSVPPDRLFEPSTSRLRAETDDTLQALAVALGGAKGLRVEVSPPSLLPPVRQARFVPDSEVDASAQFLEASRAARVRERVTEAAKLQPRQVRLVARGEGATEPVDGERRVLIRVFETGRSEVEPAPALDSEASPDG